MRFYFLNTQRPKRAAKKLAVTLGLKLSQVQEACAYALGYIDWHDLAGNFSAQKPSLPDQFLSEAEFRDRQVRLTLALSNRLKIASGRIQYALSLAGLSGDREFSFADNEAIRTKCWRIEFMPKPTAFGPGSTFFVKERGLPPDRAYCISIVRAVKLISDKSDNGACATFEAKVPKQPIDDFVPLRFWLPYGRWTDADGSVVLFSRDYAPLWRVSAGRQPERLPPNLRVRFQTQNWFTDDVDAEWYDPITIEAVSSYLTSHGIHGLPELVDFLPRVVLGEFESIRDGIILMNGSLWPSSPFDSPAPPPL